MPEITIETITPPRADENIAEWIRKWMAPGRSFLLAHADDGVIWGKLDEEGRLVTSHDCDSNISPPLQQKTLQQAFIFGVLGEVRLWREGDHWRACPITGDESEDTIEETQVLWGTEVVRSYPNQFTHVREKRQHGMDHIVPIGVSEDVLRERRLRLAVRHFIRTDPNTGEARIALSRLVNLYVVPPQEVKA